MYQGVVVGLLACLLLVAACAPAATPAAAPPTARAATAAPPASAAAPTVAGQPPPAAASSAPAARAVAAQPLSPPRRVRVANAGLAAQGPTFLAIERGYFADLGLQIEVEQLNTPNDSLPMLSSGQLEVGFGAISPALYNAAARGVAVRLVADHGSTLPGRSTPSLAVRTDLLERKPWEGYGDLRGMKLAISQLGGMEEYLLEAVLGRGGLQRADLDLVQMPFPDMAVAFGNRAIDAAIFNEPWATQQEGLGTIRKLVYGAEMAGNVHIAGLFFGEEFARDTPAARNFLVGYLRGVRDYWDAYDGRLDFQHVVNALTKHTPAKDESLIRRVPPTGQNPAGYLDPAKLVEYQDWFAERGLVPQKADVGNLYDPSFADYANAVLGPYQPVEQPRRPS